MSTIRGKAVVNPSQNIDKEKATWDPKANEAFIEACLEQITKGEHLGSSFTKVGWKGIQSKFTQLLEGLITRHN